MQKISEGKALLPLKPAKIPSKRQEVFYNPVMKLNRDITILLLNSLGKKGMQIALPLAGSGIRGIRMLLELKPSIISCIQMNDKSKPAVSFIKAGIRANSIPQSLKKTVSITNKASDDFLLQSSGFDYLDIDPFGSPNPFLDAAIKRISRGGILAVTATDTAPLCGTYPKVCRRKYWAEPIRNEQMHEIGLRILIRKIQLVAAQYEKALIPIFSYSKDHYFRTFLRCEKSREKADSLLGQHKFFLYCPGCMEFFTDKSNSHTCCKKAMHSAGPIFTGPLTDQNLAAKMLKENNEEKNRTFLQAMADESRINKVGIFRIDRIVSTFMKAKIPRKADILKNPGITRTHFDDSSYKADMTMKEFIRKVF
jgi:tRNA (guanine26-N2/guanine27-N2)-dimethyltransferase